MIFKTFENNDIDKWTAKIGLFGKSFNDVIDSINKRKLDIDNLMSSGLVSSYSDAKKQVGGLFSYLYPKKDIKSQLIDVDTMYPKIDTSNVKKIKAEIVDMSKSVANNETTWQELFDTLPSGKKHFAELGQQMEGQIITEDGLIAANEKIRVSAIAHNNALKQMTIGAKAANVAMKGLAMAGNMIAGALIGLALSTVFSAIDDWIHRVENAKKSAEEFKTSVDEMNKTHQENTKTIEGLNDEYKTLSKGVDGLGRNVSLTESEFSRYHEITNQVADMMPDLVQGWDEQGNAILKVKGNLADLSQEYKNTKMNEARKLYDDNKDKYDDVSDNLKNTSSANVYFNDLNNRKSASTEDVNDVLKQIYSGEMSYEDYKTFSKTLIGASDSFNDKQTFFALADDTIKKSTGNYSIDSEESYAEFQKKAKEIYDKATRDLEDSVAPALSQMSTYAQGDSKYWEDGNGTLINSLINSFSADVVQNNKLDDEDTMKTFITKLISYIDSNKDDVQSALNSLFSIDVNNTDLAPDQLKARVDSSIRDIFNTLGIKFNDKQLSGVEDKLGFNGLSDNATKYQNVLNIANAKYGTDMSGFFEKNKIFSAEELDNWTEITKEISDAKDAQQAYLDSGKTKDLPSFASKKAKQLEEEINNSKSYIQELKKTLKATQKEGNKLLGDFSPSLRSKTKTKSNKALNDERKKLKDEGFENEYRDLLDNAYVKKNSNKSSAIIQSKFGNIDMDKRKIIIWSKEMKNTYKNELDSWNYNPEKGGIDTVFGGSTRVGEGDKSNGAEISFSPILQTEHGAVFLSKDNVIKYLNAVYQKAAEESKNGKITEEQILAIDKDPKQLGFKVGNDYVSGLISAFDSGNDYGNGGKNNKAVKTGMLTHFMGTYGAYNLADNDDLNNLQTNYSQNQENVSKNKQKIKAQKQRIARLIKEYEAQIIKDTDANFKSSWSELDTTDADGLKSLKSDLTKLAEAGKLNKETFKDTPGATTWLKTLGIDADTAVKKVNELVDSSKQLSSLKSGISQLQNALVEKKENKVVGADTLGNMESEFGNLKSWKKYKETLGSTATDIETCRKVQNQLATEYINSNNFLSQLVDSTGKVDESTKQYYISQLKELGVKNAEQVVNQQIKKQKLDMLIANKDLTSSIEGNADSLIREGKQLGASEEALRKYILRKALASKNALKTKDSIKNLISLAKQCGVTGDAILSLVKLKGLKQTYDQIIKSGNGDVAHGLSDIEAQMEAERTRVKKLLRKKVKVTDADLFGAGNANVGVDLKDGKGSSKDKDKSKNKSSKQEFDWIERRVTVLNNKISLLNAKKDNLFTVSKKNNNLKKQIKEMTKLLGTYSTAYTKYLQKANSVKLDSKLKSKVRNGAINGSYSQLVQSYGEKIANRIQKYMDYYDKAKSSKESWETVQKQIHDAQVERLQNLADKYNDSAELNSARASKSDYSARTQNKYLTKQQKDLEKNYAYQIKIAKANGKINEAKKLQIELDQKLLELEKAKFDNIQNKYTSKLDNNTYQSNYVGNQVDIIEAKGMVASDSYYNKQISISKKRKTLLNQEHAALKKQLSTIERGTTEYYDALAALRDINLQQQENTKQEIEWNKAKAENNRKKYEAGQNRAGRRITENETLLSFIEHEDSTDSDTGQWTKAGKSRLWAYGYDLGVAQSKKTDSGKRLNELQKMLASGNYGEYLTKANLEEEIDKVISEDQANAKDVYTQRKNLADLVKDHYNQISNYLSDLISKAEESLDNQKDLYDYQKSLQEKTNNIDTIRKQLIALDGDSSEEAMAKKQQLKASLNESNEDLNSAIYDKYISDQKNILQKLQEDFKDFLEKYFKDFDALWKEGLTLTKGENGNYLLQKAKSEGNYTSSKETNTNTSNNKNQTSDQQGNKDGTGDIKTGKNLLTNTTTPTPPPDTKDPKLTKGNVNAWLGKKNALHKSGYDHLSFPTRNQKYSAVNKVISKNYKATSTSEDSDGKVVKKKVGLVLTNKQMAKLCEYVGVKTSKKYGKTSPLYKKLKSLGVKGFSKGGVVDVDDINKQVKANGDTTLISAKKGERILTPEQNKAFEKLVDTSLKNTSITSNLNVPNMANLIKSVPNNIDYGGFTFNFEVLANNPEDLVREVQTNLKYKEALKLATVGQLNGAGRLSVNRIK